jgi:hypothetical protein
MTVDIVRENRLRRMAERHQSLALKRRRRDPRVYDYQGWMITDLTGKVVASADYSLGIDEIERFLTHG